jgi:AraC family transcriptional activator of tynA and feaB
VVLARFSPATSAQAGSKGAWRDLLREHFISLDVTDTRDQVSGSVDSRLLGHLQMSTVFSVDQEIRRSPSLVRRDGASFLQIGLIKSGRALVNQDARQAVLGPGDFVVYETSRPFEWSLRSDGSHPLWELAVFTWPRASFHLTESRSRSITARAFKGDSGIPRLISDLLCGLYNEHPAIGDSPSEAFADQIGDLLAVALGGAVDGSDLGPTGKQLAQVDEFIDDNLGDPDLNPEKIARAVAISTRQLHRLFLAREMTVGQTIRARRLEGARRDIASSLTRDRSLREIALTWGFLDLAVFGRAFRQAYGMSPREYRAQQCALSGDPRAVTRPRR